MLHSVIDVNSLEMSVFVHQYPPIFSHTMMFSARGSRYTRSHVDNGQPKIPTAVRVQQRGKTKWTKQTKIALRLQSWSNVIIILSYWHRKLSPERCQEGCVILNQFCKLMTRLIRSYWLDNHVIQHSAMESC